MTEKSRKRNSNVKLEQRNPPVSKKTKDSQNGASLLGCLNSEQIQERISLIDQGFYLKCPPDFLSFYEFCKTLSNDAPLAELNSRLQSIVNANSNEAQLAKFIPLDELITYANFANDEGDFGQGLELGLSLLAFHPKARPLKSADVLNNKIKHLLSVGYKLAKKNEFSQVIEAHMDDRRIEPLTFT
ncbi:unnamed protein product [Trichobilharzia regenti]|nr:unnamed protein product [Trichobilharzia regenti]